MLLEQLRDRIELFVNFRQFFLQLADRIRRARPGNHVFALRVQKIFAVQLLLSRRRIARKGDAGAAVRAHVAEHHRLNIHGRAEVVRNAIDAAIVAGAPAHP